MCSDGDDRYRELILRSEHLNGGALHETDDRTVEKGGSKAAMIGKFRKLAASQGFREIIAYAIVGAATTLVNISAFYLLNRPARALLGIGEDSIAYLTFANAAANVISIVFAFWPNKRFVFHSTASGFSPVLREFVTFFTGRLVSLGLDVLLVDVLAGALGMNDMAAKIIANIAVLIANYLFSKFFVFRK